MKKKVRAAAVLAVVTTAVNQAREYARQHPDEAGVAVDKVEQFLRGRLAPRHGAYLDKGGAVGWASPGSVTARAAARCSVEPVRTPDASGDGDRDDGWVRGTPGLARALRFRRAARVGHRGRRHRAGRVGCRGHVVGREWWSRGVRLLGHLGLLGDVFPR